MTKNDWILLGLSVYKIGENCSKILYHFIKKTGEKKLKTSIMEWFLKPTVQKLLDLNRNQPILWQN